MNTSAAPTPIFQRAARWRWRIALGLLLFAGCLALIRWQQSTRVISGAAAHLHHLHSVVWEPTTHSIRRTGDDPYLWLEVPADVIPLRSAEFRFRGKFDPRSGRFYIYEYPVYLPGETVSEQHVTVGEVRPQPDGIVVRWKLTDSKMIRLDIPDDMNDPLALEQVVLRTRFAASDQWASILLVVVLAAAVLIALQPFLNAAMSRHASVEWLVISALVAVKIYLAKDIQLQFIGNAAHDDALFVSQASSILDAHWLGPFGPLTLSKGPTFPLFLALSARLDLPLQFSEALLHALACVLFVVAVRPLRLRADVRLCLLGVLLFDPQMLSSVTLGRVLRSGIQPALTLFALAGAIGLARSISPSLKRAAAWSVFAGMAFVTFWYSREEGIWLVPALVLILGAGAWSAWRSDSGRWLRVALLLLPLGIVFAGTWTLRLINAHYYGAPIAVDVKDGGFPQAYGALVRITPARPLPAVPVSRDARLLAYEVSPAFRELKGSLEGPPGHAWAQYGWGGSTDSIARQEIRGGWFQWALREAAAAAGHYQNAAAASAFWSRVANEINAACDAGRIPAGRRRNGFFPRWDRSFWAPLVHSLVDACHGALQISDFEAQPLLSTGSAEEWRPFVRVTRQAGYHELGPATARTTARIILFRVYHAASATACVIAVLATAAIGVGSFQRRTVPLEFVILLALIGATSALMLVIALVDVTSFSAIHAIYLAPATPPALATWILAPVWAWKFCRTNRPRPT